MRVLVNVVIRDQVKQSAHYKNEFGRLITQKLVYEWLPVKCTNCNGYGHESAVCRRHVVKKEWRPKNGGPVVERKTEESIARTTEEEGMSQQLNPTLQPEKEGELQPPIDELVQSVNMVNEGELSVVLPIEKGTVGSRGESRTNQIIHNTRRVAGKGPEAAYRSDTG